MSIEAKQTAELVKKYGSSGTTEAQVAVLSERIANLTGHFKEHKKDNHSRRGLIRMVNRRRKLLAYLKGKDEARYQAIIKDLGLRK